MLIPPKTKMTLPHLLAAVTAVILSAYCSTVTIRTNREKKHYGSQPPSQKKGSHASTHYVIPTLQPRYDGRPKHGSEFG